MGWLSKKNKSESVLRGSNKAAVQDQRRSYVSPTIEKVPSDMSKNQVQGSRPSALPPSSNRIQSPYANKSEKAYPSDKEESTKADDIIAASTSESQTGDDEADEEIVVVRPHQEEHSSFRNRHDDVSDVGPIDTNEEVSATGDDSHSKNHSSHLNSLFNGHLMKWKFDAEEGPGYVRLPAFLAGLGIIGTTTAALILYPATWTISSIVISVFVYIIGITTVILDGRFLSSSPLSIRAHLRNVITRHFGIFRYLWGRGILYLAGSVLSAALMIPMTMISGAVMFLVSLLAIFVGSYSSRKFSALRHSLSDESFLLLEFSNVDYDDDGYINPSEFASLLTSLGMELDDRYCLKAFNSMDLDHDRRISFEEFCHWWNKGYVERGRKPVDGDEESYHRFV